MIWNEKEIREEMQRLDKITGKSGSELPIYFDNSQRKLGCFWPKEMEFTFSNYYFKDDEWSIECALDVIRHEYAHYLDVVLYGNCGHGRTWKMCCGIVGARPERLYNDAQDEYYKKKHRKEEALLEEIEMISKKYIKGNKIIHPQFGTGVILGVLGSGINRRVNILFDDSVNKEFSLKWIDERCKCC